jgi:hypothetical protein
VAFRRRNKSDSNTSAVDSVAAAEPADLDPDLEADEAATALEEERESAPWAAERDLDAAPAFPGERFEREGGPWDSGDVGDDKIERVDLGGILVPIVEGMELRDEIAEERVVAATLVVGRSAIQIQPFAAPRTMGIWDEVRGEIAEGIGQSGGTVRQADGRFGTELIAEVPVGAPDGSVGRQLARFLGVDGPRWFLRAVITGEGALDDAARAPLEELFAEVVVVRGPDAMAPREPITLRLPVEVMGEPEEPPAEA